jgi:hypothetical protein
MSGGNICRRRRFLIVRYQVIAWGCALAAGAGVVQVARVQAQPRATAAAAVRAPAAPVRAPDGSVSSAAVDRTHARLRVRVSRELLARPDADLRKLDVGSGAAEVRPPAPAAPAPGPAEPAHVDVPVNSTNVVSVPGKPPQQQAALAPDKKVRMPWIVLDAGTRAGRPAVEVLQPFLSLVQAPRWDSARERHLARFALGFDTPDGRAVQLQQPVNVRFEVSCEEVDPPTAVLAVAGPSVPVEVACSAERKNAEARQFIRLAAGRATAEYPFEIPRHLGALRLDPPSLRTYGLGFGAAHLVISRLEADGSPIADQRALAFGLHASRAVALPEDLDIPAGQSQREIELHPSGMGVVELTATGSRFKAPAVRLVLEPPILPVLACLSGAAFGALLPAWRKRDRGARLRRLGEGVVVGALFTGGVLLGLPLVQLFEWALRVELGWFIIAALAGLVGTPLLELLVQKVIPGVRLGGVTART